MKKTVRPAVLMATALLLSLNSCQKDAPLPVNGPPQPLIEESRDYFEKNVAPTTGEEKTPAVSGLKTFLRQMASKNPLWDEAYIKTISTGEAVVVPLTYKTTIYTKAGKNKQALSLNNLSYLMIYKDQKKQLTAELVTWVPDGDWWDTGRKQKKPFEGKVMVENWRGKFVKGYRYNGDGTVERIKSVGVEGKGVQTSLICASVDWYVCFSTVEQISYTECRYEYTETTCTGGGGGGGGSDGGGWSPGGPPDGGGGGSGGSPNPGDYTPDGQQNGCPPGMTKGGNGVSYIPGDCGEEPEELPIAVDTIITDKFAENEKAMCALNKLMQNNTFQTALNKFIGENKPIDLTFKIETIASDPGTVIFGNTQPTPLTWNADNIDLIINSNIIDTSPSIEIALTLLHEGIHAEIYRKLLIISGPANLTNMNFPSMFNLYSEYKLNQGFSHEYMAKYYVDIIGDALKQYDNSKFDAEYYKALAWKGLEGTNEYNKLEESVKTDITNKKDALLVNRSKENCND